jgi:hypothetical protein
VLHLASPPRLAPPRLVVLHLARGAGRGRGGAGRSCRPM